MIIFAILLRLMETFRMLYTLNIIISVTLESFNLQSSNILRMDIQWTTKESHYDVGGAGEGGIMCPTFTTQYLVCPPVASRSAVHCLRIAPPGCRLWHVEYCPTLLGRTVRSSWTLPGIAMRWRT